MSTGYWTGVGFGTFQIRGALQPYDMPLSYPGAGTKQLWADPADGYRVKFAA